MSPDEASRFLIPLVKFAREDIARAKSWIMATNGTNVAGIVEQWLKDQSLEAPKSVDISATSCEAILTDVARSFSARLAFYQAMRELISASILLPSNISRWEPSLEYRTPHGAGGIDVRQFGTPHPERLIWPPLRITEPADPDIFLKGIDCRSLHSGIEEAIEQSLTCFRRGLYMPATAMLAAAAEATWTECALAVAMKLSSTSLQRLLADEPGFGKLVSEVRKVLEPKTSKPLLDTANRSIHDINDAEVWTTSLRDRRNALHWGNPMTRPVQPAEPQSGRQGTSDSWGECYTLSHR